MLLIWDKPREFTFIKQVRPCIRIRKTVFKIFFVGGGGGGVNWSHTSTDASRKNCKFEDISVQIKI